MGLKLRYYDSGLIRSEGDAPNGVLAISTNYPEMTFIVHPKVEVPKATGGGVVDFYQFSNDQSEEGAVPVEVSDIVGGCVNPETAAMVWTLAVATCGVYVESFMPQWKPEKVVQAAEFAVKVRDALAEHDYIARR